MSTMSGCCLNCGGLIPEPNKTYGWGGKFCYCAKPETQQIQFGGISGISGGGYHPKHVDQVAVYLVNEIQIRDKEIKELKEEIESLKSEIQAMNYDLAEGNPYE